MKNIYQKVHDHLIKSEYYLPTTRDNGRTISPVVCPECGKSEAFTYSVTNTTGPLAITCNRSNKCGTRTNLVKHFNIKQNVEKEFPPDKKDPRKPARIYLELRSLKKSLHGLDFFYEKKVRGLSTGAVMFRVGDGVSNGRLLNPLPNQGKTHNIGSTRGKFWQHPAFEYNLNEPTAITEGIIDALSLIEMGQQAIAVLASGANPTTIDLSKFTKLLLAFDFDHSGILAAKKWKYYHPEASVIMPDQGQDWNSILCSGRKKNK